MKLAGKTLLVTSLKSPAWMHDGYVLAGILIIAAYDQAIALHLDLSQGSPGIYKPTLELVV